MRKETGFRSQETEDRTQIDNRRHARRSYSSEANPATLTLAERPTAVADRRYSSSAKCRYSREAKRRYNERRNST